MDTLPKPAPDAAEREIDESAPPLFEVTLLSEAQRRSIWVTGVVLIVVILIWIFPRPIIRSCGGRRSNQVEAVNHVRQIGLALFEFQVEYGKFPDAETIAAVQQKTGTELRMGTKYSNDFFRQLLAGGFSPSERQFYAHIAGTHLSRPENDFATLQKGECGFTYFLGATEGDKPGRPLVVTPMIPGTDRFDPKPFGGKAVLLRLDNSVTSLTIDKHGHVLVDGRNLMDPHHPIWDGHAPMIAWPE